MDQSVALSIFVNAFYTTMFVAGPILIIGLIVGVVVALLQSLTQIQEMTLTFIPKMLAIFIALLVLFPWMYQLMAQFTINLFTNIPNYVR